MLALLGVDAVKDAEVEDVEVVVRVDVVFSQLAVDGVFAAIDGFILVVDDAACASRSSIAEVAGEARDRGDDDDDAEFTLLVMGADDGVDYGFADEVVDGGLMRAGGGDEELIFDVHKVLGFENGLDVCVLDAFFFGLDAV